MNNLPWISCVCISQNRPHFLKKAISHFRHQSYPNKDLVILCDSSTALQIHSSERDKIKIINIDNPALTLGELRNISIQHCSGEYFCNWDDDDWYHNQRLELQIKHLLTSGEQACVLDRLILYNDATQNAFLSSKRYWEGSLLCKTHLVKNRFRYSMKSKGEDNDLVMELINGGYVSTMSAPYLYTYLFHGGNTWDLHHFQMLFDAGYHLGDDDRDVIKKSLAGDYSYATASEKMSGLSLKIEAGRII